MEIRFHMCVLTGVTNCIVYAPFHHLLQRGMIDAIAICEYFDRDVANAHKVYQIKHKLSYDSTYTCA
jgi:energy-converting hydrogenase Eha subunit C